MEEALYRLKRTHMCTELSAANIGETVTVMGWVHKTRNLGGVIFVGLRDRTGILQVVFNNEVISDEYFKKAETVKSEYVIAVKGSVVKRTPENINPRLLTGEIEIMAQEVRILNK